MSNTPIRGVRVPRDVWEAARRVAEDEGTTVSEVVRRALIRYVKRGRS